MRQSPVRRKEVIVFLNRLDFDEKNAFLALAHHVARSDADFSADERVIIAKYCMEMQIDDIDDYKDDAFDLEKVLSKFTASSHRNIVLLELMVLVYADGRLAEQESLVIDRFVEHCDMNPSLSIIFKEWAKSILSLYTQGEALIHL
jgi:uncharacterized tellurite resistance protein B-like protein